MSHKRGKIERPLGVQLGLIITPMLDMSFQILAFFIMTYHPSALEGHIAGSLTPPENTATKSKEPAVPADPALSVPEDQLMPELDAAITVQVKAVVKGQEEAMKRRIGEPAQIFIRGTIDTVPELLERSDVVEFPKALEILEARLKQMGGGKGNKANLKIAADGGLRYQYVLQVYDAAKRAGFDKIHFVPPAIKSKLKQ
jgi:biopolymer transport protein ExbD